LYGGPLVTVFEDRSPTKRTHVYRARSTVRLPRVVQGGDQVALIQNASVQRARSLDRYDLGHGAATFGHNDFLSCFSNFLEEGQAARFEVTSGDLTFSAHGRDSMVITRAGQTLTAGLPRRSFAVLHRFNAAPAPEPEPEPAPAPDRFLTHYLEHKNKAFPADPSPSSTAPTRATAPAVSAAQDDGASAPAVEPSYSPR
jgi:hypothetical protein